MSTDDFFRKPAPLPSALFEATFNEDVSSYDEMARVVIPAFDTKQTFGPCPWPSRHDGVGLVLPSRGDRALVAISDDNEPWVVMWWPY